MKSELFKLLDAGNIDLMPFAVINGNRIYPETSRIAAETGSFLHWQCTYAGGGSENIYFTVNADKKSVNCRRLWQNGSQEINLTELGFTFAGIDFGGEAAKDYFYHNENPRIFERFTFPVDFKRTASEAGDSDFDETAGNRWADPGVVCERIGRSPYQPFPAIHLGNYEKSAGLLHGTLLQRVFYHNYEVRHNCGKIELDLFSSFKAQPYLTIPAGKILTDMWFLGYTPYADDFDMLFAPYTAELRKVLPANYGKSSINRDNMVWGSWNDGIFRKVSEELILREARFLKDNFPTVRWIQLDDGYAASGPPAHGLGVPYEGEKGIDSKKFPGGLRRYSDKIREIGLRPAIWIGGFCPHTSSIYQEHPEWFCDYSYRVAVSSPLDVSIPEVREYMRHALDILVTEGGFDGVKHDFWSYAFEDSNPLLKNHEKSGYQFRDWWLKELRNHLAPDGFMQTGCDIVMGNPFLGEYFTNYRYGIDVGNGNWDYVKTNFQWGAACFATHTGDLFVPNSDSIGLFKELSDTDARFLLDYIIISRSMVEIAGKLSYDTEHHRMKWLKKAACCVNNGQDVFLPGFDYRRTGRVVPEALCLKSAHFSALEENNVLPVRTVGLFNCEEQDIETAFTLEQLQLDPAGSYRLINMWSHETLHLAGNSFRTRLMPHQSLMIAIAENRQEPVLLDADIEVTAAERGNNSLIMRFGYDKSGAELFFSRELKAVTAAGGNVPFSSLNGVVVMDLPGDTELEFIF